MKIRRLSAVVAGVAAGALVLSACSNQPEEGSPTGSEGAGNGTLTVAETNSFFSFNPSTSNGNTDINSKVIGATRAGFYYINPQLEIVKDESFGTYVVESEDPLVVTYTVNEGVTWSDGEPIDADDLMLSWAILSANFDSAGPDGEVGTDDDLVYFDSASSPDVIGLTDLPEIGEDGRSVTLTYSEPAADWEISFGVDAPAHVVAQRAGLADGAALIDLIQTATPGEENAELRAVADFWNTGYDSTTLPDDPDLYLASGPYIVSDVQENQTVTLVPNEAYTGDLKPSLDSIIMRTIPDSTAAVQALQNGDVDIISPQSSADTLAALEGISNVTVHQGDQLSFDHIDLTFNNGGPFDPATYGGDAAKAQLVREAFLMAVPRQAIVDAIVVPQKPDGAVLNSTLFISSQDAYADAVASNGSDAYPLAGDTAAAAALLAEAGVPAPAPVRILYNVDNPNRVDAYTLIAAAATEAGFTVVDEGDPDWGSRLGDGTYDATIFGWISPGVGVGSLGQIYTTGQGSNFSGYSNAQVDALAATLAVTVDAQEQEAIQIEADGYLFADAYGLPLFQSPGLDAVNDRVAGIDEYMPNQTGVWWNVWEWAVTDG